MRLALVLMGGGARAAYQAGVLQALAEIAREVEPARRELPFAIVCGSSAGAINAAAIASHADDFPRGAARLLSFWEHLRAEMIYRTDWLGVAGAGARWLAAMSVGWAARRAPRGLLDNAPLADLLRRELDFHRIGQMLGARRLHALSITALSYTSGRHLTFYAGSEPIHAWRRAQRTARMVDLSAAHLLASSAIPFVFPAVPLVIDGRIEYFGDGSIRQIAPLSPAIHFGGDRIVVIGAAAARPEVPAANGHAVGYPSLAQIGQQVLASVFLDSIGTDIERIEHVNRVVEHLPRQIEPESGWRHVDVLAIAPSERIELIAAKHLRRLPLTVRGLLGAIGGNQPAGASFASYLLFEAEFTRELIALGHADALRQRETLAAWLASASPGGGPPATAHGLPAGLALAAVDSPGAALSAAAPAVAEPFTTETRVVESPGAESSAAGPPAAESAAVKPRVAGPLVAEPPAASPPPASSGSDGAMPPNSSPIGSLSERNDRR